MAVRKKTKFEEELDKILEDIAANNEDWNDPLQKGMYDFRQFQNGTAVREDDPLTRSIKEQPVDTKAYFKTEPSPYPGSKYGWPILAKEGEPAYNDPSLVLRNAAATAGDRRDRNIENAKRKFAQTIDDLDRNLNPESYGNRRSGRIVPAGGRAGLANLNRPQYLAAMNDTIQAPKTLARENIEGSSANSKEAQYDKVMRGLGFEKNDSNKYEFKNNASAARREALQKSVDDYDKQIKALEEEIALSEAGDPLYDLAVMRLIMEDDNSLMSDIRSRIAKRVDREFQEKQKKADQEFQHNENELNRQNTIDVAKANKDDQKAAQLRDLKNNYESALRAYNWAVQDLRADSKKPELKRNVQKAKELLRQAASKADMLDDYYRLFGDEAVESDKIPLWDEASDEYGVSGKGGLAEWVKSIKNPKEKARVLRDLKNTYNITEDDLGFSGAETKINEEKAANIDAVNAKVNAEEGKLFDSGKDATDYLKTLPENVRNKLTAKYDKASKKTKIVKR